MRHCFLPFFCLLICLVACKKSPEQGSGTPSEAPAKFTDFTQEFLDTLWSYNPGWASYEGNTRYDSLLFVPDEAGTQKKVAAYQNLQVRLAEFDTAGWETSAKMDYAMMLNQLESGVWYNTTFDSRKWNPSSYNPGSRADRILKNVRRPLDDRLRVISAYLAKIPAYMAAGQANLDRPTLEHTQLGIVQVAGSFEAFKTSLPDSLEASDLTPGEKELFFNRLEAAFESVKNYHSHLRQVVLPAVKADPNRRSFRIGEELFKQKFELDLQAALSAEEVVAKARARKAYLHQKMAEEARKLWPIYGPGMAMPADSMEMIRLVLDAVSKQHVKPEAFVSTIRGQIQALEKFVRNKDLLTLDPEKPLVVRETPKYMRGGGAGASVSSPGPYDKGGNTYYNVTPLDDYTPEQAESYLREYNDFTLQILNIHEAVPGHYVQLVYSNESPSIIKSVLGNGAMVEGWAVYSELMMMEAGYGADQPELWLMYYKWNLRAVLNTLLDYAVHVEGIEEADALNMLIEEGFQEEQEAKNKWRRARLSQVQLCSYYTGFAEILDLRETLQEKSGTGFDLKAFHEQFLSYGSAPVKLIRQAMEKGRSKL
ncbi:MAG: DUF885 domain-containing protein [Bacteroidota bacterium]